MILGRVDLKLPGTRYVCARGGGGASLGMGMRR